MKKPENKKVGRKKSEFSQVPRKNVKMEIVSYGTFIPSTFLVVIEHEIRVVVLEIYLKFCKQ